ncbi:hypothetical protein ACFUEJ_14945 [Gordonia sp. NPDC057258]|uniref:hypothetical protein n=1 Tax=unclassified Gordonia (in: high G+C Gram-positive bacteria) TaxID=2657482 RepID=UPI00362BEF23
MKVRQDWNAMRRWLIESFGEMEVDDVIDIGDREAVEDQEVVDCCDVTKLDDGFVVRLSRIALVDVVVVDDELLPDHWDYGDDLATDGRLYSTDVELVAAIAIGWFRDRLRVVGPEALGFTFCGA